ncbi:hypothetical protein F8388_019898, partial [Cannabis sativa]
MASSDKDLEVQLLESRNRLVEPSSSVDELLPLLDCEEVYFAVFSALLMRLSMENFSPPPSLNRTYKRVENCLSKVDQSPSESMQSALSPSLKALVDETLLGHTNVDVKVVVASCISEITRITAPDAPYDDDQMKEVFRRISRPPPNSAGSSVCRSSPASFGFGGIKGDDGVPGRVRVAIRLRPRNAEELAADADFADCVELQSEVLSVLLFLTHCHTYEFDELLTEFASQKRVYEVVAKPVVESVLDGYNGT